MNSKTGFVFFWVVVFSFSSPVLAKSKVKKLNKPIQLEYSKEQANTPPKDQSSSTASPPAASPAASPSGVPAASAYSESPYESARRFRDPDAVKTYNILINPLGLLFGDFNGSFNMGIADNISVGLGGDFLYLSTSTLKTTNGSTERVATPTVISGFGVHGRMNYYLDSPRFSDGWYVSPIFGFQSISVDTLNASNSGVKLAALVGYHWVYKNGFNIMLGGGVSYSTLTSKIGDVSLGALTGIQPALEFNLGYTF